MVNVPLPNTVLAEALPTVKLVNKPTLVKLLVTTDEFNVVPIKFAALAVITVLLAAVSCPCWLTVYVGILSPLP